MQQFWHNCKGAVTVLVTLLLIPAILLSGTAVDLARIYTAKSLVQDANQLASNSLLASYDAMLQDLYGIFGIMQSDPKLGGMLDEYIQITIFGDADTAKELGTFQLFYGSDLHQNDPTPALGQNLGNPEVLRRQIEEYMKLRAPLILVQEVLDKIDSFEKIAADSEAVADKVKIDSKIDQIDRLYKEIYDLILEINAYSADRTAGFAEINGMLDEVPPLLATLEDTRTAYAAAVDEEDTEAQNVCLEDYEDTQKEIKKLVNDRLIKKVDATKENLAAYTEKLDQLVKKCGAADVKKAELSKLVDDLETQLKSGDCSTELKDGLTKKQSGGDASVIDHYRSLLRFALKPMAEAMHETDSPQIAADVGVLEDVSYGHGDAGSAQCSLENLASLQSNAGYAIDALLPGSAHTDLLGPLAQLGANDYRYDAPCDFLLFESSTFDSTHNGAFYKELKDVQGSKGAKKKKSKANLTKLLGKAQSILKGYTFSPEGALVYGAAPSDAPAEMDWSKEGQGQEDITNRLNSGLMSQMGNLAASAGDKVLLLTYGTEMFSNYTTTSDPAVENIAGIPMGIDVNYFFQSEQEYMLIGSDSAIANLAGVTGLLFLVRFVLNYVASFSINEIKDVITAIKFSCTPLVGELARFAIVAAESALDVGALRSGEEVVLYKNNSTWKFSPTGLLEGVSEGVVDISDQLVAGTDVSAPTTDDGLTVSYSEYLRLFLLLKNGDDLAGRIAELIALNVTNKKESIGDKGDHTAREAAMSKAELFDLSKAMTGFAVTTTVDLKMLFLSMPLAQQGVGGVVPPKTFPITMTDYRGY